MNKKIKYLFKLIIALSTLSWCHAENKTIHIAVAQIVAHPALDTLRQSLQENVDQWAKENKLQIQWQTENAHGNPITAAQIAKKIVSQKPQIIVALSTPMAQTLANVCGDTPLIFGAVTEPKSAKLANSLSHPRQITGVTDAISPKEQIAFIKKILPHVKTIGLIFNPGETNSRKQVEDIKAFAQTLPLTVKEAPVTKTSEVPMAANHLVEQVDAILLPTDNTVVTGLEGILKITNKKKIPVFGSDVDIVKRGALAALGIDWRTAGSELADIVKQVIMEKKASEIPIQSPKKILTYINNKVASEISITIPQDVLKHADKVL